MSECTCTKPLYCLRCGCRIECAEPREYGPSLTDPFQYVATDRHLGTDRCMVALRRKEVEGR